MTLPIEAKSLSSLISLAADPPRYPRNITHEPLQPLTLYIVRIPGSQDVILTPLKPPTRASINVDAINTSLYYLHVSTEEDEVIRQSISTQQSPVDQPSPVASIQRKPLPLAPHTNEPYSRPAVPSKSYPDYQPGSPDAQDDSHATRHTFRGQNLRLDTGEASSGISRKPLGPRPLHTRIQSADSGSIKRKPVEGSQAGGRSRSSTVGSVGLPPIPDGEASEQIPALPTETYLSRGQGNNGYRGVAEPAPERTSEDTHITIIRRDPSSGVQWNIGSLSIKADPSSDSNRVELEITTPGYQKFVRQISPAKLENLDISSFMHNKEIPSPQAPKLNTERTPHSENPEPKVFTRHLTMPRPKPKTSRRRSSSDPSSIVQSSLARVAYPPPAARPPVYVPHINSAQAPSQQHFSFISPWGGSCAFSTAMDGRSLKCRHLLPTSAVAETGVTPPAPVVAELKFNLPWPSIRLDALKKDQSVDRQGHNRPKLVDTAKGSWRSSLQKLKDRSHSRDHDISYSPTGRFSFDKYSRSPDTHRHQHSRQQSSEISNQDPDSDAEGQKDDEHGLDLTLGREKAGGGRGGQSAKLGKLILRDEGLKMMDLVVAAGMGVWWSIHNREKRD